MNACRHRLSVALYKTSAYLATNDQGTCGQSEGTYINVPRVISHFFILKGNINANSNTFFQYPKGSSYMTFLETDFNSREKLLFVELTQFFSISKGLFYGNIDLTVSIVRYNSVKSNHLFID